jgi:hypothetical protein
VNAQLDLGYAPDDDYLEGLIESFATGSGSFDHSRDGRSASVSCQN